MIVTGGKDNLVKVWDIAKKRGWSYTDHMNEITDVMVWDGTTFLSASADRTIRYWDISDPSNNHSFKGHAASVSHLRRLGNRLLSSSLDGTVRLWETFSGHELSCFADHNGAGVQILAHNQWYMASYSGEWLVVRDWNGGEALLKVGNFGELLGLQGAGDKMQGVGYEIGDIQMCNEEPFLLFASESRRIRVWDLRTSIQSRPAQTLLNPTSLPSKSTPIPSSSSEGFITKAYKMRYQPERKRLVAHFFGAKGLMTFDMRKGKGCEYYGYHYYPMTDFDMGTS